ncbi:MAG: isocitrate lyase/PEP mutase family protein [Alphaproteobacteria bacterium]|jgi:carboxyvinyl-carboxyphosphonate phosphorylmutase|nr:isocitrate lyase/PEP mutase family protein [Alphaproteobacteria bacterium]MDP6516476.1 isocitrate lyase/PEP mutase family protein [Alphaproteobacteria bacterium]
MSRWTDRRQRFRAVLSGKDCVHPASVFDPVSARIAEDLGFEIGMLAGSVASMAVLGAPDLIVLTLTEFADQAHRIGRAANLPLLVDADHGYGNALNVMRTVEELENAGVAGLSIEDTALPTAHGAAGKPSLTSIEEGVGKIRAAVEARADANLVIAGRTSAPGLTDIADAVARAKAYQAAGADALFLVGLRSRDDLDAIAGEVTPPLIIGGVDPEMIERPYLASRGVRVCLQGHHPFAAAVQAIQDTMAALRDGTPPAKLANIAEKDLMGRITRREDYARWTDAFL